MTAVASRTRLVPLMESFGPTIQGEGALAGLPTLFLRFGLCDYRCVWCDSKFSVEPETVKRDARRLTQLELLDEVKTLAHYPGMWITLSGGNPAMHELGLFVSEAKADGYLVSVETQGSLWREWLQLVDHLTISPKPPSSEQLTQRAIGDVHRFIATAVETVPPQRRSVKIVVFNEYDFEWARNFIGWLDESDNAWQTYLSVGTPSVTRWGTDVAEKVNDRQVRDQIGDRYAWLCGKVAGDPLLVHTRVLPQLHVVAWGHARGV